jgi:hypothetical protein
MLALLPFPAAFRGRYLFGNRPAARHDRHLLDRNRSGQVRAPRIPKRTQSLNQGSLARSRHLGSLLAAD